MISQYSKAPTFVSNHQDVISLIDRYDKEFQRINQDVATASKAIGNYHKSIDILKQPVKDYFDSKYNESIDTFSDNIDLTKRGQVYKVENTLNEISTDPIIKNGIQSTANFRKIQEFRNKINTDPKYAKLRNPADEYVEQLEMNAYLTNPELTASFTRTTPEVTINADEHYKNTLSKLPFEEVVISNGVTNIFQKVKTFAQGTNTLYGELNKNPELLRAEQNNFRYLYKTPQEQQAFVNNFNKNKQSKISDINTAIADIAKQVAVAHPEMYGPQIAQLKQQEANLLAQKNFLQRTEITPDNAFQAYLLDKTFNYGLSNISTKEVKTEVDKARKYFTDQSNFNRKAKLADDQFAYKKEKDRIDQGLKATALNLKAQGLALKSTGSAGTGTGVGVDPNTMSVTPALDVNYTPEMFESQQTELKLNNQKELKNIITQINMFPGTELNNRFKTFLNKDLLSGKHRYLTDKELADGLKIKEEIVSQYRGTDKPLPLQVQEIVKSFDTIKNNNDRYRFNEALEKRARKLSGYDPKNQNLYEDVLDFIGVGENKTKYETLLKGYNDRRMEYKAPAIAVINQGAKGKLDFSNERATVLAAFQTNGAMNAKGERFQHPSGFNGSGKALDKDKLLDDSFLNSVDFNKSFGNITVINGQPVVKMNLVQKGSEGIKGDKFPGNIMYIPVPIGIAQGILNKAGSNINMNDLMEGSTLFDEAARLEIPENELNQIFRETGVLDVGMDTIGGIHVTPKYQYYQGSYYIDYNFGKLGSLSIKTQNPKITTNNLKQAANTLKSDMVKQGLYTPEAFKQKLEIIIASPQFQSK